MKRKKPIAPWRVLDLETKETDMKTQKLKRFRVVAKATYTVVFVDIIKVTEVK